MDKKDNNFIKKKIIDMTRVSLSWFLFGRLVVSEMLGRDKFLCWYDLAPNQLVYDQTQPQTHFSCEIDIIF